MKKLLFVSIFVVCKILGMLPESPQSPISPKSELFIAIEHGNLELVKQAISVGADVNFVDPYHKMSPLMFSIIYANSIKIDVITQLIKVGANVNEKCQCMYEDSPLIHAVYLNDLRLIKLLIKNGAVVNYKNNLNQTALHIASERGHQKIIKFLEKTLPTNIKRRKQRIKEILEPYISTGFHGPLEYILQYAEEYVCEDFLAQENLEEQKECI